MHLEAETKESRYGPRVLLYVDDSVHANFTGFLMDLEVIDVPVKVSDAFRTCGMQALVAGNSYGGEAYGTSLHEGGYAVDINWNELTPEQRTLALDRAKAGG